MARLKVTNNLSDKIGKIVKVDGQCYIVSGCTKNPTGAETVIIENEYLFCSDCVPDPTPSTGTLILEIWVSQITSEITGKTFPEIPQWADKLEELAEQNVGGSKLSSYLTTNDLAVIVSISEEGNTSLTDRAIWFGKIDGNEIYGSFQPNGRTSPLIRYTAGGTIGVLGTSVIPETASNLEVVIGEGDTIPLGVSGSCACDGTFSTGSKVNDPSAVVAIDGMVDDCGNPLLASDKVTPFNGAILESYDPTGYVPAWLPFDTITETTQTCHSIYYGGEVGGSKIGVWVELLKDNMNSLQIPRIYKFINDSNNGVMRLDNAEELRSCDAVVLMVIDGYESWFGHMANYDSTDLNILVGKTLRLRHTHENSNLDINYSSGATLFFGTGSPSGDLTEWNETTPEYLPAPISLPSLAAGTFNECKPWFKDEADRDHKNTHPAYVHSLASSGGGVYELNQTRIFRKDIFSNNCDVLYYKGCVSDRIL